MRLFKYISKIWAESQGHDFFTRIALLMPRITHTLRIYLWPKYRKYFVPISHVSGDLSPLPKEAVYLFCAIRNEQGRLAQFLDHYRRLGVSRFYIVDNDSSDQTRELLAAETDVALFWTKDDFGKSRLASDWTDRLIAKYGRDRWVIVVDSDELFVYPRFEEVSLATLCGFLEEEGADSLRSVLIDMYADTPLYEAPAMSASDSWLESFPCFDSPDTMLEVDVDADNYGFPTRILGGVRRRLFGIEPTLDKCCLFFYSRRGVFPSPGHHYYPSEKASAIRGAILHFKLTREFVENGEQTWQERSDCMNADEYLAYHETVANGFDLNPRYPKTCQYESSEQLVMLGYMQAPKEFRACADLAANSATSREDGVLSAD